MSTQTELRTPPRPLPELEAEQEVDFGRYWSVLVARWWLPLAGLAIGIAIGFLASAGQSRAYQAQAVIYLGQPLTPGGFGQVQTVATNFKLVNQLLHSGAVVRQTAARAGLRPEKLRNEITLSAFSPDVTVRLGSAARLAEITVSGVPPKKAVVAANALAKVVVDRVSGYMDVKIAALKANLAFDQRELKLIEARLDHAYQEQQALLKDKSLSSTERLIAITNYDSIIGFGEGRRAGLVRDRLDLQQSLALANQIERARILESATASRAPAPGRHTSAAVGGLVGLILGVLAALLWEPVARRLARRPAL